MPLYTRTGDDGTTGTYGGMRVEKNSARIHAIGDIDELNTQLGNAITVCKAETIVSDLQLIQQDLFNLGGEISLQSSDTMLIGEGRIEFLEERIDEYNQTLKPLKEFILPGGDEFCSRIHLARSVCRRAERSCVDIMDTLKENNIWFPYLNRLRDYLFVLARYISSEQGAEEILWDREI